MKKIIAIFLFFISLNYAIDNGELSDFSPAFSIRSLENGIILSVNRDSSDLSKQNWILREVVLSDDLQKQDPFNKSLPFGYVQFVEPNKNDSCLGIDESGFFVAKSCKKDLETKKLETVFSIIPTTTSAVQIRSLVLQKNECISTFENPNLSIEQRFGIKPCALNARLEINLGGLFILTPALKKASVLQ